MNLRTMTSLVASIGWVAMVSVVGCEARGSRQHQRSNEPSGLDEAIARVGDVAVAMERAEVAARNAGGAAGSLCDHAHRELEAWSSSLRASDPALASTLLEREAFVARCSTLQDLTQRCLGVVYSTEHLSECRAHEASLDAKQRATLDSLFAK